MLLLIVAGCAPECMFLRSSASDVNGAVDAKSGPAAEIGSASSSGLPGCPSAALPSDSPIAVEAAEPPIDPQLPTRDGPAVWGIAGVRGYPYGEHMAPNGVEYHQLFAFDLNFNLWLWRRQGLYLFAETSFWGQKPGAGITNSSQGAFDFSKRELDLDLGLAWNYHGPWEARLFAYSFNNLNRGASPVSPAGYRDGFGLENRYYLGSTYADLGTAAFDEARATFLSVGYYPTKRMVDADGQSFKPGPFLRAYLTWDLWGPKCYLFGDTQFIASQAFAPTLLNLDAGVAVRPFDQVPRLEFRLGSQDMFGLRRGDPETSLYLSVRYIY
jgi:hypothetical protein